MGADVDNYDTTQIGNPYARATRIVIDYPVGEDPTVTIEQSRCVRTSSGEIEKIRDMPTLVAKLNMSVHGPDPIPLVHPGTGAALGPNTSLNTCSLNILAVVRSIQLSQGV